MGSSFIRGWRIMVNQAKLRGYKFLIEMKRITIGDVPKPYRQVITDDQ